MFLLVGCLAKYLVENIGRLTALANSNPNPNSELIVISEVCPDLDSFQAKEYIELIWVVEADSVSYSQINTPSPNSNQTPTPEPNISCIPSFSCSPSPTSSPTESTSPSPSPTPPENQSLTLQLTNWSLWDVLSSSHLIYSLTDTTLYPNQPLLIWLQSDLNNGGDGVLLKNQNGMIKDEFNYNQTQADHCWSLVDLDTNTYQLTPATPGEIEFSMVPEKNLTVNPTPTAEIAEAGNDSNLDRSTITPTIHVSNQNRTTAADHLNTNNENESGRLDSDRMITLQELQTLDQQLFQLAARRPRHQLITGIPPKTALHFSHPTYSKTSSISVIIGGICWLGVGWYLLQDQKQKK